MIDSTFETFPLPDLRRLVQQGWPRLGDDRQRMKARLKDEFPEYELQVFVLSVGIDVGAFSTLAPDKGRDSVEHEAGRLCQVLMTRYGLQESAARWCVAAWGYALGRWPEEVASGAITVVTTDEWLSQLTHPPRSEIGQAAEPTLGRSVEDTVEPESARAAELPQELGPTREPSAPASEASPAAPSEPQPPGSPPMVRPDIGRGARAVGPGMAAQQALPGAAPTTAPAADAHYAGFWIRFGAYLIDVAISLVWAVVLLGIGGATKPIRTVCPPGTVAPSLSNPACVTSYSGLFWFLLLLWIVGPLLYLVVFWSRGGTLGQQALGVRVVDAVSHANIGVGRAIVRLIGFYLSSLAFSLGLMWVGWDRRKQGWHDKMAATVCVIK